VTESSGALSRLGNVLYWLCTGVAALFALVSVYSALFGQVENGGWWLLGALAVLAIVVWLIGRAARYILAGK